MESIVHREASAGLLDDKPVTYGPFTVEPGQKYIESRIDRALIISEKDRELVEQTLELSLDGGKSWGYERAVLIPGDPPRCYSLWMRGVTGGGDFRSAEFGNDAMLRLQLPPEQGQPIQWRFTIRALKPVDVGVKTRTG